MQKKYEFTGETMEVWGRTLNRIRAVRAIARVATGELGGWIETERNLSHEGDAWVSGNAEVCDKAKVYSEAKVSQQQHVAFSYCTTDLSNDTLGSLQCQCNLLACNGKVICYKHVGENLESLHDPRFVYPPNGEVQCETPEESVKSCASGLHASHASCWEMRGGRKVLLCSVDVADIITIQMGKIRCRKLTVLGVCENKVY